MRYGNSGWRLDVADELVLDQRRRVDLDGRRFAFDGENELAGKAVADLLVNMPVLGAAGSGLEEHLDHHEAGAGCTNLATDLPGLDRFQDKISVGKK